MHLITMPVTVHLRPHDDAAAEAEFLSHVRGIGETWIAVKGFEQSLLDELVALAETVPVHVLTPADDVEGLVEAGAEVTIAEVAHPYAVVRDYAGWYVRVDHGLFTLAVHDSELGEHLIAQFTAAVNAAWESDESAQVMTDRRPASVRATETPTAEAPAEEAVPTTPAPSVEEESASPSSAPSSTPATTSDAPPSEAEPVNPAPVEEPQPVE